ncbi:MAG: FAD-binding protein [Berryella intestinalis]|uniref:FAD-dependent oxidoreductase n=1 Tax=Berryella intestinalis TaxID=1531429 RepID=UPI002A56797C|nr:FAD-binding protein [Berryella intestinalis]MDD7369245.1 FAD-binding protein [Berryella intestinalis]MDY3128549.1 FAD-binding protein [Berryella intestinalis]
MEKHERRTGNVSGAFEDAADRFASGGLDRRGFLKGAAISAISVASASALAACAPRKAVSDEALSAEKSGTEAPFKAEETVEADVVIVGCGASGFMAAVRAAKEGAKVIVLEKGSNLGAPNGIYVSGPFAVGTDVLKNKPGGTTLTVDDAFHHVMNYSHWTPNPALLRRCLEVSKDAVAELEEIDYTFEEKNFRFETPFIGDKGGFHLITVPSDKRGELWEKAIAEHSIDVRFNTALVSLATNDNGAVTGVNALERGKRGITFSAKAVVLAGGGYLGNRDLQERFLHTRKLNVARGGESTCTGDTIVAAERIGAALEKTWGYCPCEYGGTHEKASRPAKQDKFDQNTAFKFGLYGCLLVDAGGKRFINEGLLCDYPMSYGSEQILRNSPWYAVVDQAYVDAMTSQGLYQYTTAKGATEKTWFIGNYFKDRILDKLPADIEEGIAEGWCFKADTLEELAEHFGLDDLPATVERYNEHCSTGEDADFGTNPWYLSPVATPPFYVTENEPSAWSTFGGLRIDESCRVLAAETNDPIPGLFAIGTDAGSLYYSPYYDIPGFCYGLCIDSGYIAAEEIISELKA